MNQKEYKLYNYYIKNGVYLKIYSKNLSSMKPKKNKRSLN